jgi:hypothetical protein
MSAKIGKMIVENAGEEQNEVLEVRVFAEGVTPASAGITLGATVNTGNYSSVKLGVHVTLPCYAEEMEATLTRAQKIADRKLNEMLKEVKK